MFARRLGAGFALHQRGRHLAPVWSASGLRGSTPSGPVPWAALERWIDAHQGLQYLVVVLVHGANHQRFKNALARLLLGRLLVVGAELLQPARQFLRASVLRYRGRNSSCDFGFGCFKRAAAVASIRKSTMVRLKTPWSRSKARLAFGTGSSTFRASFGGRLEHLLVQVVKLERGKHVRGRRDIDFSSGEQLHDVRREDRLVLIGGRRWIRSYGCGAKSSAWTVQAGYGDVLMVWVSRRRRPREPVGRRP